ncbi:hypothetical protein ABZ816_16085 [Actinosynnema sp. NPDC047251]|uniref:Carrier domain-containing protein n=1 Tax=Saccharothrix espanaensis (strain ATCC 51144 / DSM 44229 / JCM 9112 / NBRC 15066 / NRRL 15764) TaxID=1179773 RepID=K0JU53_SACES|nr:hypothetical protein [Saccharothrix espanaensis]CCH29456.1 hypothetical protein BN6_21340 [Saccharothrix espanaensis DSM 44229]
MITESDVARLLRESGLPLAEWDSSTELVLDSLTSVWLLHHLEEQYGIVVGPEDEDEVAASDSIGSLHLVLRRVQAGALEGARHVP